MAFWFYILHSASFVGNTHRRFGDSPAILSLSEMGQEPIIFLSIDERFVPLHVLGQGKLWNYILSSGFPLSVVHLPRYASLSIQEMANGASGLLFCIS